MGVRILHSAQKNVPFQFNVLCTDWIKTSPIAEQESGMMCSLRVFCNINLRKYLHSTSSVALENIGRSSRAGRNEQRRYSEKSVWCNGSMLVVKTWRQWFESTDMNKQGNGVVATQRILCFQFYGSLQQIRFAFGAVVGGSIPPSPANNQRTRKV